MNVITMESEAFKAIMKSIEDLERRYDELISKTGLPLNEKWLDSADVCALLKISKRKLQNLRDTKKIAFSRFTRKTYYKAADIESYLKKNYVSKPF